MSKTTRLQHRIVGKTRQAVGEIIGDQTLHDEGKAQAERGRDEQDAPSEIDPLKKPKQPT
ncbi:CsbD family protein [Bradyrhizobium diversitatis]|uniref:CsbD family protein n=1 Tax=Bradyrhizobium diversitatis TaxID=2755406 RepID=A0ABS0NZ29_9BRAD|nr:CsbD family protein [Bradyrhizobium diversitatis]MBH5386255.1 CsbD family protein [Bradyrhizobium diversitatis]